MTTIEITEAGNVRLEMSMAMAMILRDELRPFRGRGMDLSMRTVESLSKDEARQMLLANLFAILDSCPLDGDENTKGYLA